MKKLLILLGFGLMFTSQASAMVGPEDTLVVKSSLVCAMCEETLTEGLKFEKGVLDLGFNLEENLIMVVYNTRKTKPEKLKVAISRLGYKADEVLPVPEAYQNLHECCKNPHD